MTATSPQGAKVPDHLNDSDIAIPQVSVVVADLEDGMRLYSRLFGWNPWTIYEFRDLKHKDVRVGGKPGEYEIRVAIARAGGVDFELIEPLGPSPYQDYLDDHGPGFHHIQFVSPTVDCLELLREHGFESLCSGEFGVLTDGGFGYSIYDRTDDVPFIIGTYSGDATKLAALPSRTVVVGDEIVDVTSGDIPSPTGDDLIQVGVVVEDVDDTLRALRRLAGWGPWRVFDFRNVDVRDRKYRGQDLDFAMRIATLRTGNLHMELLSPTGPGPYQDFLDEFGPGLHHIQVRGDNPSETYERLIAGGADIQFGGRVMIDETSGLDFCLFEGANLPHLVEVTVGDRAKLMDKVTFDLVSGD